MVIRKISYVNTLLTGKIRLLAILGDETTVILNIAKRNIILMAFTISLCGDDDSILL